MSETKWTKGPWEWDPDHPDEITFGSGMRSIATIHDHTGFEPLEETEWEANARLIAAAPRLYEALEAAYGLMAKVEESAVEHVMYDGRAVEQWCNEARAALAAARGEE